MKLASILVSTAVAFTVSVPNARRPEAANDKPHITMPDSISWGPAPAILPKGATAAVLDGDPTKPGSFTMRLSMPGGYQIAPHFHPADEHITVVSGAMYVGMGDRLDESAATELPTGAFGALPAGMHHFAFTKAQTVIQLHGLGPWSLTYVNKKDDPRGATR